MDERCWARKAWLRNTAASATSPKDRTAIFTSRRQTVTAEASPRRTTIASCAWCHNKGPQKAQRRSQKAQTELLLLNSSLWAFCDLLCAFLWLNLLCED